MADGRQRLGQWFHIAQEPHPAAGAAIAPGINLNIDTIGVRASPTAQPISVLGSCPAWSVSGSMCATRAIPARTAVASGGGQHRAGRDMPAPVLPQTGP